MYKYYPKHAVWMMVFCAIGFGVSLQGIWSKLNVGSGSLYIPIVTMLISIGLFITALTSVKDWYEYVDAKYDVIDKN